MVVTSNDTEQACMVISPESNKVDLKLFVFVKMFVFK